MSGTLRYRNPELCDQLASRYITGRMTSAARRRLERLMHSEPTLEQAVARWADRMAPLQDVLPERAPPAALWSRIEASLPEQAAPVPWQESVVVPFRRRVAIWRGAAIAGLAATLALAVALFLGRPQPGIVTASYLAPLSHNGSVALVVTGYKGQKNKPSQLVVQWSQQQPHKDSAPLYLWAEDRQSHALVLLGKFSNVDRQWPISKTQWQAVAHSSRLLVGTTPERISADQADYIGPCLQLKRWRQQS